MEKGMFVKIKPLKDGCNFRTQVVELAEDFNSGTRIFYIWDKADIKTCLAKKDYKVSLPTVIEDAYEGVIIETHNCMYKVLMVSKFGCLLLGGGNFNAGGSVFWAWQELKRVNAKLLPQEGTDEERKAIKLLESRGLIKDGKILSR